MPADLQPSPVIPRLNPPMWTAGVGAAVALGVWVLMAVLHPQLGGWLLAGGVLAAGAAWVAFRPLAQAMAAASENAPDPLLADAFEALEDPVLVVAGGEADDIAGRRIRVANAAARELFRISREGALLVSAIRDPAVLEVVDEALFARVTRTAEHAPGGPHDRRWRVYVRPLPKTAGAALALLTLRDETDARRTEEMRVDFLANASHELRTPLASLSGFIETLKGHARDDEAARDRFLGIMAAQADRMGRLVADLLSLSRIELNEHIAPLGDVNLSRAAADVVDALAVLAREKGVTVRLTRPDLRALISGDRDQIIQVIQNLVDNGLKYSPAGSTVEIDVRTDLTPSEAMAARLPDTTRLALVTPDLEPDARFACVTVRDHGAGMAREHLPRLTERFYRVEGQKSGERSGTGLGLAIVKHIVNRHRGGMAVESAPGLGTAFTVWLPLARSERLKDTPAPTR